MLGSRTDKSKLDAQPEPFIHFVTDKTTNKLTLIDSGISRTKSEFVNLGTIARFGMKKFMEALAAGADVSMLGQFVAGYLAHRVVVTIKHNDCEQCVWQSQAGGLSAVTYDTGAPTLKVYQLAYLEVLRLINNQKSEDNSMEYTAFYKSLTNDWEDHLAVKHFSVERQFEFKAMLLVRKRPPFSLFNTRKMFNNIMLYVPLVLIMGNCEELIPEWLRFVMGIVDPEEIPLNFCQMPQQNKFIKVMGKNLANMCVELFFDIVENEDHDKFDGTFSNNIKLGIHDHSSNRTNFAELLRYCSTKSSDVLTSLKEYVTRMEEGQNDISYIRHESKKALENSLFPERLKKWIEVLWKAIKEVSGNRAGKVTVSDCVVDSPCCLVTGEYDRTAKMERIMKAHALSNPSKKKMEINPESGIMMELCKHANAEKNDKSVKDLAAHLLMQADDAGESKMEEVD